MKVDTLRGGERAGAARAGDERCWAYPQSVGGGVMDVLGTWVVAFANLRDGQHPECPSCHTDGLRCCTKGEVGAIGFGAVWCEHCGKGTWISRLTVREGDHRCPDMDVPEIDDVSA